MMTQLIGTPAEPFTKLFSTNGTASSITAPTPTTTEPSGNGVFSMISNAGPKLFNQATFLFYGTRSSADNETFTARITSWRNISGLWIPTPLLALSLTQGTSVGVAGQSVVATEYFADTIVSTGVYGAGYEIVSPADNTIARVSVDALGAQYLQVQLATGTNASCNCLAAPL